MKKIILLLLFCLSLVVYAGSDSYIRGKVYEKIDRVETPDSEQTEYTDIYNVKIGEGIDKGKILPLEFPIYREEAFNLPLKPGKSVVLYTEIGENGDNIYYIADLDKRGSLMILSGIFLLMVFILARFKGLRAIAALLITILATFMFFLPGVIQGYSPIVLSVVTAVFASLITIYFMTGFSNKGHVAVMGSVGGVAFAGILSYIFTNTLGLTGYTDIDSLNYASFLKGIKVKELISAGVILGSMGAVMDVAMSISSALHEVEDVNMTLTPKQIFQSGMNIGRDIIGTMVNTLVLAYVGSSLFTIMLLIMQKDEFPLIRILNFEFMTVEILRSLCGSLGILVAVPLTSYLASVFHERLLAERKKA